MELKLRTNGTLAELTAKANNDEITSDIVIYNDCKKYHVDESIIENLISVANDISRFNKSSDYSFVYKIVDAFLNDSEREELFENYGFKKDN